VNERIEIDYVGRVEAHLRRCEPGWHVVDGVALFLDMDRQVVIDAAEMSGGRLCLREGNTVLEEFGQEFFGTEAAPVVLLISTYPPYSPLRARGLMVGED